MSLRHSLLQTSAVWCDLEAACYETDYQTCRIFLPGAPYAPARPRTLYGHLSRAKGPLAALQQKLAPTRAYLRRFHQHETQQRVPVAACS
jgi:hypothetical protein